MSVIRLSSVLLLLTVVLFISCGQTTEEIKLAVAGLDRVGVFGIPCIRGDISMFTAGCLCSRCAAGV